MPYVVTTQRSRVPLAVRVHKSMTNTFYRKANGFILVYDITNRDSFKAISSWMDEIGKFLEEGKYCRFLVGAKSDLESSRAVPKEQGQ